MYDLRVVVALHKLHVSYLVLKCIVVYIGKLQ